MAEQHYAGAAETRQQPAAATGDTPGTLNYLRILYEGKWFIFVITVSVVILVVIGNQLITPTHTVRTTLRVLTPSSGTSPWETYNVNHADRVLKTYVEYARSRPVRAELQRRMGLDDLPPITIEHMALTELIVISTEDTDAHKAALVANTLADLLIEHSADLYAGGPTTASDILDNRIAALEQRINDEWRAHGELLATANPSDGVVLANERKLESLENLYFVLLGRYEENVAKEMVQANMISVIEAADPAVATVKPNKRMNLILGVLVGLVGGAGMVFVFESIDPVLYTPNQIGALVGLPVLGKIPRAGKGDSHTPFEARLQRDAFQRLRATLFNSNHTDKPLQTLIVSSAEPAEGKSTIAANLAIALAERGKHVALVDADLYHPVLHEFFDLKNDVGLGNVLEQKTTLDAALTVDATFGVHVLPGGRDSARHASALDCEAMTSALDDLKQRFDVIIIDTPAFLPVAAGAQLAPHADGVLLVAARGRVRQRSLVATHQQLCDIDAHLLGVVVNRTHPESGYQHYDD